MQEKDCNNTESLDFFQNYECNIEKILEKIEFKNEDENDWKSKHIGYFNTDYFEQIDRLSNKIDGKPLKKIIEECHHAKIIENINTGLTRYFKPGRLPPPPPPPPGQKPGNKQTNPEKPKKPPVPRKPRPDVPQKPEGLKLTQNNSRPTDQYTPPSNLPAPDNTLNSNINSNELNNPPPPPPPPKNANNANYANNAQNLFSTLPPPPNQEELNKLLPNIKGNNLKNLTFSAPRSKEESQQIQDILDGRITQTNLNNSGGGSREDNKKLTLEERKAKVVEMIDKQDTLFEFYKFILEKINMQVVKVINYLTPTNLKHILLLDEKIIKKFSISDELKQISGKNHNQQERDKDFLLNLLKYKFSINKQKRVLLDLKNKLSINKQKGGSKKKKIINKSNISAPSQFSDKFSDDNFLEGLKAKIPIQQVDNKTLEQILLLTTDNVNLLKVFMLQKLEDIKVDGIGNQVGKITRNERNIKKIFFHKEYYLSQEDITKFFELFRKYPTIENPEKILGTFILDDTFSEKILEIIKQVPKIKIGFFILEEFLKYIKSEIDISSYSNYTDNLNKILIKCVDDINENKDNILIIPEILDNLSESYYNIYTCIAHLVQKIP